jgi:hypothetical protein
MVEEVNEVKMFIIPEHLMPDENNQFLDITPSYHEQWMIYDLWEMDLAIKLITIGYPVWFESKIKEARDWPVNSLGRHRLSAQLSVYDRALSIAKRALAIGKIKDPDTPLNWIAWAKTKGYNTDHLEPLKCVHEFERALAETENESLKESYREQMEGWQKVAEIWGVTMAEPMQDPQQGDSRNKAGKRKSKQTEALETLARDIGNKWMLAEEKRTGERPGVEAIAKHVEKEFKNLDKRGPRGDYLDWQTIKREALTGITGRLANGKSKK